MMYYLLLACACAVLGAIALYRAYVGTRTISLQTISHLDRVSMSKRQRWAKGFLGICYLGLGIAYMVLTYMRIDHELR